MYANAEFPPKICKPLGVIDFITGRNFIIFFRLALLTSTSILPDTSDMMLGAGIVRYINRFLLIRTPHPCFVNSK